MSLVRTCHQTVALRRPHGLCSKSEASLHHDVVSKCVKSMGGVQWAEAPATLSLQLVPARLASVLLEERG